MPFSGIALNSIFREFDVNVALCMTSAAQPSPQAMQEAGRPMAYNRTGNGVLKDPSTVLPSFIAY